MNDTPLALPDYQRFNESIAALMLPISASELHGVMCGYIAAGASQQGEAYIRALLSNKHDEKIRAAVLALFNIYAVSQQQMANFEFEFQLLLPRDQTSLAERARAFSEWCEGFTQGLTISRVDINQLDDEEVQEAVQHITEFAHLDYQALQVEEEDERALMEVTEYARMAVIHIYNDIQSNQHTKGESTAH